MDNSGEAAAKMPSTGIPNPLRTCNTSRVASTRRSKAGRTAAEAFEHAIDNWGDTVLRLATVRLNSRVDAEDVYQTVFLKLFQANIRFRDEEHVKAWLLRVTVNCCNDIHRSPWKKRRSEFDDTVAGNLNAPVDEGEIRDEELTLALASLTNKQRVAIHLFYFEGYATDEIAQITGERSATVRSHLHRARNTLRRELGANL